MSQTTSAESAIDEPLTADAVSLRADLETTVRALLTSAADTADLVTLELRVPGAPELSTLVLRAGEPLLDLTIWTTAVPPGPWHDGLMIVASAPDAAGLRRAAVAHTADLLAELLTAERRILQAEALARRALDLAGVDPLTQLGNRRTWRRALEDESKRASRHQTSTTIAVLDLDGMKLVNDEHGHRAGDAYLQRCAEALRAVCRSVDVICRLGGDEFGVIAPETGDEGAARLAERLRDALARADVLASVGVATAREGTLEDAWHVADGWMDQEKRQRALRARSMRDSRVGVSGRD